MTAQEYVDAINNAKAPSIHHLGNEVDMMGVKEVAEMDRDEHRWYILGTTVFQVGDGFFGVHGPLSLKSESMGWEDVDCPCSAFLMKAIPSITYVMV